jgi:ubiquinone/menaquinone biosynthesis C-methylase UbiE
MPFVNLQRAQENLHMMKDNFSTASDKYAAYRPKYPSSFFEFINAEVREKRLAWDCGTGNGQVAIELAKSFDQVFATDISQSQLDNAFQANNISYSLQPAEKTNFSNHQFNLIVVAQAIHWFDFDRFYAEVNRTAKDNALICVVGYGLLEINEEIDRVVLEFYNNIIGKYWDKERKYIDEHYKTIPFPFTEIQTPAFQITQHWTLEHLIGFFNTWSAVKHFIKQHHQNPVEKLEKDIAQVWGNESSKAIQFPFISRIGRISIGSLTD